MDDHDLLALLLRQLLQPLEQIKFFRSEQLLVESSDLLKRGSLAKHERARRPFFYSAQNIPAVRDQVPDQIATFNPNRAAAREASARLNCSRHCRKQLRSRNRIRIYEYQPITRSL